MSDLNELHGAIRGQILRGVVTAIDDSGPEQLVTVDLHWGQTRSGVPVIWPYGLSGHVPLDGAICHVIQTGADPSDIVALPVANPTVGRIGGLPEGDTILYDAAGQRVWLSGGKIVRIDAASEMRVSIAGQTVLDVTASGVTVKGNLSVSGKVVAQGDVTAAGVSLQNHVHGGVQPGSAQTAPPNQ